MYRTTVGNTALMTAILAGNLEGKKDQIHLSILSNIFTCTCVSKQRKKYVHVLRKLKNIAVKLLLNNPKVTSDVRNDGGDSPLMYASMKGLCEVFFLLFFTLFSLKNLIFISLFSSKSKK